ncbi:Tripartite tricarboxylate transporter TctB family protein [Salinihabitans flavidus]|uniref:Tripartite tricarboxylate transporter TctB family protein n=1 Tax=Salinihabitans flavidus TaxID=569882 RepID=A0A1H8UAP7_9RHOB|nr:tripartite tricarboxylate transporter TctB family protein [Salinihabitans flavidus]SEP00117.1 Tripartite tricarboxylate transporter TctB family protein [Salinihabitans flavidus]
MPKISLPFLIGAVFALLSLFLIWHTFSDVYQGSYQAAGRGPVFFPQILLSCLLLLSLVVMFGGLKAEPLSLSRDVALPVISVLLFTGLYVYAITAAGFLLSTIVFTFVMPLLLGYRRIWVILAITAVYPVTVWYLFDHVVQIVLPSSPWFDTR